ncbi:MAG: hypothetical protein GY754_17910 [bacterium]|nr:hypothetical protein [bacterium]
MTKQVSFSTLGNKYMHQLRHKVSHAEDKIDLENQFSYTITNFLKKVFEGKNLTIAAYDVVLNPGAVNFFTLSSKLLNSKVFMDAWDGSDMPHVIKKFADTACHRYIHLDKHSEKTENKLKKR